MAFVQENRILKNRNHFRLPDCDQLESHGNGSKRVCSHIGLTEIDPDQVTCEFGRVLCLNGYDIECYVEYMIRLAGMLLRLSSIA